MLPLSRSRQLQPNQNPMNMNDKFLHLTKVSALVSVLAIAATAAAQDGTIYPLDPPAEPGAIVLGTGGVKDQHAIESWFRQWGEPMVRNVTTATLTPFLPDPAKANGTAVIVAPGGGFRWLSINNEGWKIAKALNERGVAAFVLKYRLIPTPPTLEGLKESMNRTFAAVTPPAPGAAAAAPGAAAAPRPPGFDLTNPQADAEAAYALIVKNADQWHVDTSRIGMMGFSAGAGLTMQCILHSPAMKLAFIAPIYGNQKAVEVPKDAPPLFVALAINDPLMFHGDFGLIKSWWEAKRPVEFHLYQDGGHGFGMGYPNHTTYWWFEPFVHWLDHNKFLEVKPAK
jgi:acetyl esterase/lipase